MRWIQPVAQFRDIRHSAKRPRARPASAGRGVRPTGPGAVASGDDDTARLPQELVGGGERPSVCIADLLAHRRHVSNLPCLHDLSVAKVSDDRLVDSKAPAGASNTAERRSYGTRHDYSRHFDVSVNHNLLYVMTEVGHCGERLAPDLFLGFGAVG